MTRRGVIYRSDALCHLDDSDRDLLRPLGIKTAFDLRQAYEIQADGNDQLDPEVQVISMPTSLGVTKMIQSALFNPAGFRLVDFYISSFDSRADYHADLFRQISDPARHPAVIHCTAGKDRTGIFVALLLRIAGVSDDQIIADYAETTVNCAVSYEKQRDKFRQLGLNDLVINEIFASTPDIIRTLLIYLDQNYGSAENYLMHGGVAPHEIERFRAAFVE